MPKPSHTTRLAPSPSGDLHLGNARTFLINWALAKQLGWDVVLRIEDIDQAKVKDGAIQQSMDDLAWLGMSWNLPVVIQSSRRNEHENALERLIANGDAYPCVCTRKEILSAASAPHADDGATIYPGTCRDRFNSIEEAREFFGKPPAIRFAMPDESLTFTDAIAGVKTWSLKQELGDFVIAAAGQVGYQLAVVVDDIFSSVTHIVRGDDLIDSVARQVVLYRVLGMEQRVPEYFHVPLVTGPDGRRLAKRHAAEFPADTRLIELRRSGIAPTRVIALLAQLSGIESRASDMTADEFTRQFQLATLPAGRAMLSGEMVRQFLSR